MSSKFNYSILLHYSEIALKLNNRKYFEKIFIKNIKHHIQNLQHSEIKLVAARVFIHNIDLKQWDKYKNRLKKLMGLQHATLMIKANNDLNDIKQSAFQLTKNKDFSSFRITTKRNNKKFKYNSNEISIKIGNYVQKKCEKPVNLNYPDLNIIIEVLNDNTYVGYDRVNGFSGLPSGSQEKAISLISSGIDSPVASFEMIKRGINLDYIHFHSFPAINKQSIDNVKKLLEILTKYQLKSTLYLVPLLDIQQKIMELIPDKYWVIFFRRFMIHIANFIGFKNESVALVTGDSVGQVASQTLSNIRAISDASDLPILRPLAGMNKENIINRAKEIGTYDISILPYEDCCSFFVPPHPETKAKMNQVNSLNSKLDLNDLVDKAIKNTEKINITYGEY